MSPDEFEALRQHLHAADPAFLEFASCTEYTERTTGLSRYPTRRLEAFSTETGIHRGIELSLDLDSSGRFFKSFSPDLPYTLWGGAWVDLANKRYSTPGIRIYEHRPWCEVVTDLLDCLHQCDTYLQSFDRMTILSTDPSIFNHNLT